MMSDVRRPWSCYDWTRTSINRSVLNGGWYMGCDILSPCSEIVKPESKLVYHRGQKE